MGRVYYISTGAQTVAAVQDLLEIKAASNKPFVVHGVEITDAGNTVLTDRVDLIRATSGYTVGSGGGSAVETKADTGDNAAGVTSLRNNTTQAVAGGGSLETIDQRYWNRITSMSWFPPPNSEPPKFLGGQALIVAIQSVTAGSVSICCTAVIEEIG